MPTKLFLHQKDVDSVFELLGDKEDDISYALGWVLSKSDKLLKTFVRGIHKQHLRFKDNKIQLQEYGEDKGYTDLEITIDDKFHLILEAKKGWNLPERKQLQRYRGRFGHFKEHKHLFVTLSDTSREIAKEQLPSQIYGVKVKHVSWELMIGFLNDTLRKTRGKEKALLQEFKKYVQKVIAMPEDQTNLAYCVALATDHPGFRPLTPLQIVEEKNWYFFPIGVRGWPNTPPKYVAFRYRGKLHSIHHVERVEKTTNFHRQLKELPSKKTWTPHFALKLGPSFEPRREVVVGNIWSNGRLWVELDTLFTSNSIEDAVKLTKKREKKYE